MPRNNRIAPPLPQAQTTPRVDSHSNAPPSASVIQRAIDAIFTSLSAVVDFLQPYAQPDPWHAVTFQSTWSDYDTTNQTCQYTKDPLGYVHLRGLASRSAGAATTVAVLPVGYRPVKNRTWGTYGSTGAAGVSVTSDGLVVIQGPAAGALYIALDGIYFDTRSA